MNKKSQFYIITALILLATTFPIFSGLVKPVKPVAVFEQLYANYELESPKVVNSALYSGKDVSVELRNFTTKYLTYAKTRDPNFRILYVFAHNSSIEIGNYLDFQVNVSTNASSIVVGPGNNGVISLASAVTLRVDRFSYKFVNLTSSDLVLKSLFRTKKDKETKVHVSG